MKTRDYKRLQFDFSENSVKSLDNLANFTEASSRAEVVRNALRLYEYALLMQSKGYELTLQKDDEKITLAPFIGNIVGNLPFKQGLK
jgi:hypothetical protein